MAEFSQLIKKFDKIRDYMRDFYVYGFKTRNDFTKKSLRTYDNERRRCESYLGEYMKFDYGDKGKTAFVSVDCSRITINPLYAAWKSKSFTKSDIMLHFYILDNLKDTCCTADELTDAICLQSGVTFDVQTVRNKCKEYIKAGLLTLEVRNKSHFYSVAPDHLSTNDKNDLPLLENLTDAITFFQGSAPFGEIGSYILDTHSRQNNLFVFKHHYIAHTLENGILFDLLCAIRQNTTVYLELQSERTGQIYYAHLLPLKIFVSASTGRRYICAYSPHKRRYSTSRLDYIKKIVLGESLNPDFTDEIRGKLSGNLPFVWGVGFGGQRRSEILCMKLHINEVTEQYIITRIMQEGQGGELLRLYENTFLYTKELFDTSDMSPWIKTFIGRIIALEGTNREVINRFYNDIGRMAKVYGIDIDYNINTNTEQGGIE